MNSRLDTRPAIPATGEVFEPPLPPAALLRAYQEHGALTDCFAVELPRRVDLTDYLLGFCHSRLFRLERRLLGLFGRPTRAADVQALAMGSAHGFAFWRVEARVRDQLMMVVEGDRIRTWWMVEPAPTGGTRLLFGSALMPVTGPTGRSRRGVAAPMLALHRWYSRALLRSTVARLAR